MKAKYLILLALGLGLTTSSCNDFLETQPSESYSPDLVWNSASNIQYFIYGRYSSAYSFYRGFSTWDRNYTNNMVNSLGNCPAPALGNITPSSNYPTGLSDFGYIRNCNMIIENCTNNEALTAQEQSEFVAIGKLLRAMCYYDYARKCGKFIWVGEVLDTDSNFELPLTSGPAESYSYVLKDLREAIPNLPTSGISGTPTRNYALALLSEVCLTAAAYTNDAASLQQNGVSLYQEAINAVDQISGVSLDPNYGNMFNENGAYSSPEIILAQYWSAENTQLVNTSMQGIVANIPNAQLTANNCSPLWTVNDVVLFEAWGDNWPSQNLVDAYLVIDDEDGVAKPWNETSQWLNNTKEIGQSEAFQNYTYPNCTAPYDDRSVDEQWVIGYQTTNPDVDISDLMYNNRDARFGQSIIYNGQEFYGETCYMFYHGNFNRYSRDPYGEYAPIANYGMRKGVYTNVSPRFIWDSYTAYHEVISRYGRALLNKAEAQLRLGDVAGAVATFNQTRTIHGQLPASTATTLADAWTDYKRERRVELFWENDWYFSLLRWGMYGGEANYGQAPQATIPELNEPANYIEINREGNTAMIQSMSHQNDMRMFVAPRGYLFPIPQSLINSNPALSNADQNPGY
ncbi:MAG: RagB/SusD family nutrient uptake outer membrane protein [Paramuribaculum sp.]|nr:RagB/SusD family nutrient uptake outer membrane protein [Paramuribaculum sp.]